MSQEGKHTPGPWVVELDNDWVLGITSAQRQLERKAFIGTVEIGYDEPFESEQQANALLIAASPRMLKALQACAVALADAFDFGGSPRELSVATYEEVYEEAVSVIRDALEGEVIEL